MPYEAGEALLWERQNHRVHAHLCVQMKELQAQHDAYNARIQATESIAEAAEAAVHKVKQMEARIAAMEEDDKDRPFDAWAKEAIGHFQVFVDNHAGVRQKLSGLEQRVGDLVEDVDSVRDVNGQLRSVMRRLEVLEDERKEEGQRTKALEKEVARLRNADQHRESADEMQQDDNPLHVFYGIDASSHQNHSLSDNRIHEDDRPTRLPKSPEHFHAPRGKEPLAEHGNTRAEENRSNLLQAAPEIEYGWENTQQFKDMEKELAALRAMCRTQDPMGSGQSAEATQTLQETIVLPRENDADFSDATTETEAEDNDVAQSRVRKEMPRSSIENQR